MNMIYWLSILGVFVGFVGFLLNVLSALYISKYGTFQEQISIAMCGGIIAVVNWWFPLVGLVSLIVALTIG